MSRSFQHVPPLPGTSQSPPPAGEATGDAAYFAMPPEAERIRMFLAGREPVWLHGPTGCGKSTLLRILLRQIFPGPIYSISLHGDTSFDDFIGTKELRGSETTFREGPLLAAMRRRRPFLIEEIDIANWEVTFGLQPVAGKQEVVIPAASTANGDPETLDPWGAPADPEGGEFVLCATANTYGRGDPTGAYRGVVQNEAFLNRWVSVRIDYPGPAEEAKILRFRYPGIGSGEADGIAKLAEQARSALKKGKVATPISVRNTTNWARFMVRYGMRIDEAFTQAVLVAAHPDDREPLSELFQRVFGVSPGAGGR